MQKFSFDVYTEWNGNEYETITKVFADIPDEAKVAIAKDENWSGCHWFSPSIVYVESVPGLSMSKEAEIIIRALNAKCVDDEDEEDEEACKEPSLLTQWLIDKVSG